VAAILQWGGAHAQAIIRERIAGLEIEDLADLRYELQGYDLMGCQFQLRRLLEVRPSSGPQPDPS
jgi:hypothetical protein